MQFRHRTRKLLAVAAIGVIALTVGTSARAYADPNPSPLVSPGQTGSINITKFQSPPTAGQAATGVQIQDTSSYTPIEGVVYEVTQVPGVDLTTNAGWVTAANTTVTAAVADVASLTGTTETTDADGVATFTGLPIGLYLVKETSVPTGVTPASPFLVTVPITDPVNADNWLYDVYVYPKDGFTTANKTVTDANSVVLGDPVVYNITVSLPNLTVIDAFKITDSLDSRLTYGSTSVTLLDGTGAVLKTLALGDDYALTVGADPDPNKPGNKLVTVNFLSPGLAQLGANPSSDTLEVTINTVANATGEIANQALIYPDLASQSIDPGQPGGPIPTDPNGATTKWGNIVISKVSSVDGTTPIKGATFQVFATEKDAQDRTNPISINGTTSWTTDENGLAVIAGLRYTDWANGKQVNDCTPDTTDSLCQNYWLVETVAAPGYALLATPVETQVESAFTTVPSIVVKNVPVNGNLILPQTGGTVSVVTYLPYVAGGVLLVGVIIALVAGVRRRAN